MEKNTKKLTKINHMIGKGAPFSGKIRIIKRKRKGSNVYDLYGEE